MFLIVVINLYIVRIVLQILGAEDYGIYNVIGGIVLLFAFVSNSLAASSQRFFSIEIGKGYNGDINRIFRMTLSMYFLIILGILIIAETVGLWFVNYKLVFPENKIIAINIIYQITIISFIVSIISVPYNALIISYERMNVFAYIGIFEAILKIATTAILYYIDFNKLVFYSALIAASSILTTMTYIIYCHKKKLCLAYKWEWDKRKIYELFAYNGSYISESIALALRLQGVNIILNFFFNPVVNASRAIAIQVNATLTSFAGNFMTAIRPQIYKSYANSDFKQVNNLFMYGTNICFFLMSIMTIPIILETEFILKLWLVNIPQFLIVFTKLSLINAIIDSLAGPSVAIILASGKLKRIQIYISIIILMNLPLSYIALKAGCNPYSTLIISIILSFITLCVRAICIKRFFSFEIKRYFVSIAKYIAVIICTIVIVNLVIISIDESFMRFCVSTITSSAILFFLSYFFIFSKDSRISFCNKIKTVFL